MLLQNNLCTSALKSCIILFFTKVRKRIFLIPKKLKNRLFRAKNLSVNTWRSGPDICSLICEFVNKYQRAFSFSAILQDMHKISVLQLENTFWDLTIFTAFTYQKHLILSILKYFVCNQKYSLIFVDSYSSELKYYNKKLLDCIKCFNKNLYSVGCETLCSKREVLIHTS